MPDQDIPRHFSLGLSECFPQLWNPKKVCFSMRPGHPWTAISELATLDAANWGPQTMASRISGRICARTELGSWRWWAVTGCVPMVTEWAPKNGGSMGLQNPEMTPTTITHHVFESCLGTMAWTTSGAGQTYGRFKGWRSRAQSNKWVI